MSTIVASLHAPCMKDYYTYAKGNLGDQTRGITTWNTTNQFSLPNGGSIPAGGYATIVFTNTEPKCYAPPGRDTHNMLFSIKRVDSTPGSFPVDSGTVGFTTTLNGGTYMGGYLSGMSGNANTVAFEFGGVCNGAPYNEPGVNTLVFHNISSSISTLVIENIRMYRTYKMCNTTMVAANACPTCAEGFQICSGGHPDVTNSDFDLQRHDYPCNHDTCGGLSYTNFSHVTVHAGATLAPSNTIGWTIDFSGYNDGHQGQSICVFNFNNIRAMEDTSSNEVGLVLFLNTNPIATYHLSRWHDQALSLSYDLTKSSVYNDTGANTIELVNVSSVNVSISPDPYGGIDVYRIYRSTPLTNCSCSYCESGCQMCEACECCNTGQTGGGRQFCSILQTCTTPCNLCQSGYAWPCDVCMSCYTCDTCESCQDCQSCNTGCQSCQPCEVCQGCEGCYNACYALQVCYLCESSCFECQECQVSCQNCVACQGCQTGCQGCNSCVTCQSCQPCETCQSCVGCYAGCYAFEFCYVCETACYDCEACQVSCQVNQ